MNIQSKKISLSLLLASAILNAACSSGGSSSGDGGGGGSAAVPANAILIDNSVKAETTTTSAVETGDTLVSALGVETVVTPSARNIFNIAFDNIRNNSQNAGTVAVGVAFTEQCEGPGGGTITGDATETDTTFNATATFNACDEGFGFTLSGDLSVNNTFPANFADGPYTDNISGSLNVTFDDGSSSIGFNGFSLIESGNTSTGAYTITTFTFAINPSAGGGYAVQVTQALVGNDFDFCELTAGQVLITGAAGSQARATVNANGSAKIEYHAGDGNFIETENSPIDCLI